MYVLLLTLTKFSIERRIYPLTVCFVERGGFYLLMLNSVRLYAKTNGYCYIIITLRDQLCFFDNLGVKYNRSDSLRLKKKVNVS